LVDSAAAALQGQLSFNSTDAVNACDEFLRATMFRHGLIRYCPIDDGDIQAMLLLLLLSLSISSSCSLPRELPPHLLAVAAMMAGRVAASGLGRILAVHRLGPGPFTTPDPFLFCVYHRDNYPAGDGHLQAPRRGDGMDFDPHTPYRMYHGDRIPGFPQHVCHSLASSFAGMALYCKSSWDGRPTSSSTRLSLC